MTDQTQDDIDGYNATEMNELIQYKGYSILMRIIEKYYALKLRQNIKVDYMVISKDFNIRVVTEKDNYLRIVEVSEGGVTVIRDKDEKEIYLEWCDVKPGSLLDAAYAIQLIKSKLLV